MDDRRPARHAVGNARARALGSRSQRAHLLPAARSSVMRARWWRWLVSLPLLAIPGPCTTFDGDSPSAPDAGDDAADAAPTPTSYLSLDDAVSVCSLVGRCQTLQYSIAVSLAISV